MLGRVTRFQRGSTSMATILVVDDEAQIREILSVVLERKGHRVLLAHTGQDSLRLVTQERPDVIILDVILPDMNGLAVLAHIRQMPSSVPVIMLTGYWTGEFESEARALGVTDFLSKTFSLHELGTALLRVVKDPGPGHSSP